MALERMVVTNHERWGNLVKTWSTGHNYLEDDNEYPLPETVDEFRDQLAKAQVFMTVPERFKQVKFVAQDYDTIVVRLPPKFACCADVMRPPLLLSMAKFGLARFRWFNTLVKEPSTLILTRSPTEKYLLRPEFRLNSPGPTTVRPTIAAVGAHSIGAATDGAKSR